MDAEFPKPTFIVDLDEVNKPNNPTIYATRRRQNRVNEDFYARFDEQFFEDVKDCARLIDKIPDVSERMRQSKMLDRIFVMRDKGSILRMFKHLTDMRMQ